MRPHPRIRKTVKWGGAVASVILLVVWVGTWERKVWLGGSAGRDLSLAGGHVCAYWTRGPVTVSNFAETWVQHLAWQHARARQWSAWRPECSADSTSIRVAVPLGVPAIACILPTIFAWPLDALARRRASAGFCLKCSYNRAGLPPQAVCPECGAAALARPAAAS